MIDVIVIDPHLQLITMQSVNESLAGVRSPIRARYGVTPISIVRTHGGNEGWPSALTVPWSDFERLISLGDLLTAPPAFQWVEAGANRMYHGTTVLFCERHTMPGAGKIEATTFTVEQVAAEVAF